MIFNLVSTFILVFHLMPSKFVECTVESSFGKLTLQTFGSANCHGIMGLPYGNMTPNGGAAEVANFTYTDEQKSNFSNYIKFLESTKRPSVNLVIDDLYNIEKIIYTKDFDFTKYKSAIDMYETHLDLIPKDDYRVIHDYLKK